MQGDIVKAAWILGGSMVASVVLAAVGVYVGANAVSKSMDEASRRSAEAVLKAPGNTVVGFRNDENGMIKVGFEPKLPAALRVENSMDEKRGTRAAFEVDVRPIAK